MHHSPPHTRIEIRPNHHTEGIAGEPALGGGGVVAILGVEVVVFAVEAVPGVAEGGRYDKTLAVFIFALAIPFEHDSNSPTCMDVFYHHFTGRNSILMNLKVAHFS